MADARETNNLSNMKMTKLLILAAAAMFLAASCRGTSTSSHHQQYQPGPSYSSK
jgi:uncharacterized lipoprotein YajG